MLKNGVLFRIEIREKFVANASVLPPARAIDLKRGIGVQDHTDPSQLYNPLSRMGRVESETRQALDQLHAPALGRLRPLPR